MHYLSHTQSFLASFVVKFLKVQDKRSAATKSQGFVNGAWTPALDGYLNACRYVYAT